MTNQTTPPQGQWSDREITGSKQDRFATQDYANVLANRAATADTPLTIGVFGRWGSGKTSLMRLVQDSLAHREQAIPSIWINVWQLSSRDELWSAFLQALLTGVRERLPWHRLWAFNWNLFWERVKWWGVVRMLVTNSYRVLVALIPLLVSILWPNSNLDNANDRLNFSISLLTGGTASVMLAIWLVFTPLIKVFEEKVSIDLDVILKQSPYEVQVSELQKIQKQFTRLVKTAVGEAGRLGIFIDDLDRCTPDKIPEVLEAIKLFTETPLCVYVIGLDYEVVQEGLKIKYKFKNKTDAAEYLEKIIQIPFHLPPLDDNRISRFVEKDYADVRLICPTAPEVFSKGLEPNPRKVKRALNIYRTLWELAEARVNAWEMDPVEPELLAKMVVIQSRFPALHDYLIRNVKVLSMIDALSKDAFDNGNQNLSDYLSGSSKPSPEQGEILPILEKTIPEKIQQEAFFALLLSGGKHFYQIISSSSLESYIYLTGSLEGLPDVYRPSRQEKEDFLSNDHTRVKNQANLILTRFKPRPIVENITDAYLRRFGVVISDEKYYNIIERESAGYAIALFIGNGRLKNQELSFNAQLLQLQAKQEIEQAQDGILPVLVKSHPSNKGYIAGLWELLRDIDRPLEQKTAINQLLDALEYPEGRADYEPQTVRVPAGTFLMGTNDEQAKKLVADGMEPKYIQWQQPQHTVELSEYQIGKYPITNQEYRFFLLTTDYKPPRHWDGDKYPEGKGEHPVVYISWSDADAYCKWLTEKTGKSYRLPTEAEWEKAACGTDGRIYPWGNGWDKNRCNCKEGGARDTTPVGQYSLAGDSPYGCADMAGNVWEWCADWLDEKEYELRKGITVKDPHGPKKKQFHVVRGGSYLSDKNWEASATYRNGSSGLFADYGGFRVVISPDSL